MYNISIDSQKTRDLIVRPLLCEDALLRSTLAHCTATPHNISFSRFSIDDGMWSSST